jgi:hypothetical protein
MSITTSAEWESSLPFTTAIRSSTISSSHQRTRRATLRFRNRDTQFISFGVRVWSKWTLTVNFASSKSFELTLPKSKLLLTLFFRISFYLKCPSIKLSNIWLLFIKLIIAEVTLWTSMVVDMRISNMFIMIISPTLKSSLKAFKTCMQ